MMSKWLLVALTLAGCGAGSVDGQAADGAPVADAGERDAAIDLDAAPPVDAGAPDATPEPPAYGVQTPVRKDTDRFDVAPPSGYYEYLPSRYQLEPARQWPVILFLEGTGQRGNGTTELPRMLATGLPKVIEDGDFAGHDRFIVLSMQYASYASPAQVTAFIDWAKRE
jgi:hypothetical protein